MKLSSKQFYLIAGALFVVTVAAIAGGGPDQASEPSTVAAPETPADTPQTFDRATIEAARVELLKEPRMRDLLLEPGSAVILQAAVEPTGGREYGYAEYLCMRLRDLGLDNGRAVVRVVDATRIAESQGDFRSISLGTVQCRNQGRWD